MTPPTVLVDASFLAALVEPEHEWRAAARDLYASLVDAYERHEIRLRARADHLEPYGEVRKTLLAPVERMSVATQYRRAAAELERTLGVAPDAAVTLVMMKRERVRRIATFDPIFSAFDDVEVVRRDTTDVWRGSVPSDGNVPEVEDLPARGADGPGVAGAEEDQDEARHAE